MPELDSTAAQIQAAMMANVNPAPAETQPEPTPTPEPTPVAAEPAPAAEPTPEPAPAPEAPSFDYSRFGVQNDEELTAAWNDAKNVREEYGRIKPIYEKVAPLAEVADYIKNPFSDPKVAELNNFVAKTGIKDFRVATEILSLDLDAVKKDPALAIAVSDALSDPNLASMGLDRLKKAALIGVGADLDSSFDDLDETVKLKLEVAATKALKTITDKSSEWKTDNSIFAKWETDARSAKEKQNNVAQEWSRRMPSVVSGLSEIAEEYTLPSGEKVTAKVTVTPQEVSQVLQGIAPQVLSINPDDQGQAQLAQTVRVILQAQKQGELLKSAIESYDKAVRAEVEQRVRKELVNGAPEVAGQTKTDATKAPVNDPLLNFLSGKSGGNFPTS
jgi:hypothetical protein